MRYMLYASLICCSVVMAQPEPTQLSLDRGRVLELPAKFSQFEWLERASSAGILVGVDPDDSLRFCFAFGQNNSDMASKQVLVGKVLGVADVSLTEIMETQSVAVTAHLPVRITSPELEQAYIGVWSVRREVYGTTLFLLLGPESGNFYPHVNLLGDIVNNYREASFEPQVENEVTTFSVLISIGVVLMNALVIGVGFRLLVKTGELKMT